MARFSLGTIYGKLDKHQPRSVALVSQRLNPSEEYEDRQKVIRFALRNRESAFAAQLTARGIRHEIFAASDLPDRTTEIMTGNFDLCVVAGEVCSQSISIAADLRRAGFARPIYLEMTEEEANKQTSLDAAVANAKRLHGIDLLTHFVYLTKSKRLPHTIELEAIDPSVVRNVDPMSDEDYLRRVAVTVTQKLSSSSASNALNVSRREQPDIRKSDTAGWWTQLGSLQNGKIDVELWYDRFINHPDRKLWIGFHSSDLSAIRRFVTGGSFDIGEDDIVYHQSSGGWIVRKSRRRIYFSRPVLEKYRNKYGTSYFYGRYLVPRDGTIRKLGVDAATEQVVAFVQQIVSRTARREKISTDHSRPLQKGTRISFNSAGWQRPTGDARQYESHSTYNYKYGFGHEDWLFRSEWLSDGWRYAFIQGVNKSHSMLVKRGQPIDLTLFTIEPDKRRRYVAMIRGVECLDNRQSQDALAVFKKKGWYDTMRKEIKAVGGKESALGSARFAKHILNVRFRQENVTLFPSNKFAKTDDPIIKLTRYQLYEVDGGEPSRTMRRGDQAVPRARTWMRRGFGPVECDPVHARMQAKLMKELRHEYPGRQILREGEFIDVSVRTKKKLILFEIKSDLDPRSVIRHGLGQILEYAYHPLRIHNLPIRMVIVGRRPLTNSDKQYLDRLKHDFALPLAYRFVDLGKRD